MSLGAHLVELRRRLMIATLGLVAAMVVAFLVSDPIIDLVTEPIRIVAAGRGDDLTLLNFETITSGFDLRLRIAFAVGIVLSAPVWLWQVWAFVMPALTRAETARTLGFLTAAIPLFFGGCVIGWLIMPHVVELMAGFVPEQGALFYTASYYYDFVFKLMVVVGVAFVLPVFLVALNVAGVLSGGAILRSWRVAVIASTVFAALATPAADVASMGLLAGILIVLFFAAALLSMLFDRRRSKRRAAQLAAPDGAVTA